MHANSLIEVLSAAHLTRYVDSNVFEQRGGIFLVAPPGHLKSTIIKNSLRCYPDALQLADLNVQTLGYIKNSFIEGKYSTMAFGEFEKLYQRNPATASNLEGHIKGMVEEGFGKNSFTDSRAVSFEARCLLIAGVTPTCHQKLITRWMADGFARRFLWSFFSLDDPDVVVNAIHRWKSLNFGKTVKETPNSSFIPYTITVKESNLIRSLISAQPSSETPYILMKKIFCVLKWRHAKASKAMSVLRDFAESLGDKPAKMVI
jgi:hypothetical protein